MNQKGFGTNDMLAFLFVVLVSFTIVAVLYNQSFAKVNVNNEVTPSVSPFSKSDSTVTVDSDEVKEAIDHSQGYAKMEEEIAEASKAYFLANSNDAKSDYVTLESLVNNDYIDRDKIIHDDVTCQGYVDYLKVANRYTTYLKCNNYQTTGYDPLKSE